MRSSQTQAQNVRMPQKVAMHTSHRMSALATFSFSFPVTTFKMIHTLKGSKKPSGRAAAERTPQTATATTSVKKNSPMVITPKGHRGR